MTKKLELRLKQILAEKNYEEQLLNLVEEGVRFISIRDEINAINSLIHAISFDNKHKSKFDENMKNWMSSLEIFYQAREDYFKEQDYENVVMFDKKIRWTKHQLFIAIRKNNLGRFHVLDENTIDVHLYEIYPNILQ